MNMVNHKNPITTCWCCKKSFDGNFEIKNLQIVCPYCKKPQSSVFEKKSQAEIIRKSKVTLKKFKTAFKNSQP